jgi:hypothetical protein
MSDMSGIAEHFRLPGILLALQGGMKTLSELRLYKQTEGAIGYILLWAMGVPASLLFLVFLLRGVLVF